MFPSFLYTLRRNRIKSGEGVMLGQRRFSLRFDLSAQFKRDGAGQDVARSKQPARDSMGLCQNHFCGWHFTYAPPNQPLIQL